MFLSFAFAYFFAAMLRGVPATLAPYFSAELAFTAADLGLLAGAYFLGFSATQLPLGSALDRFGPRRVFVDAASSMAVATPGLARIVLVDGGADCDFDASDCPDRAHRRSRTKRRRP